MDELVDRIAKRLIDIHWDGNGCGTHGVNACSNCFGPSPMDAYEVTRAVFDALGLREEHRPEGQWIHPAAYRLALDQHRYVTDWEEV